LILLFHLAITWAVEFIERYRRPRNEGLNDLHFSPNIIRVIKFRVMRCPGHVAHMGERRGAYKVLVRKPDGKRPFRRPRRRWEENFKMDLPEFGWRAWTGLAFL
jgi:hypothetical protein